MRQPIATAPRDGKDVWVEDAAGAIDIARWSSEACKWVWKNGRPINITPTHWYPITEDVFQEDEQSSRLFPPGRAGRRLAASLVLVVLGAIALIGVFDQFSENAISETIGGGRTVGLNLKPELATAWQTRVQPETTVALMQDTDASRQMLLAGTTQRRQVLQEDALAGEPAATASAELRQSLYQERERSGALEAELARVRGDLETMLALSSKFQNDAVQRWEAAEITAEELRQSLQQEQAHSAALATELSGTRREIETRDTQSTKADDEAAQQATGREVAELRQSLQQEQEKTAALTREVGAARQAMTASAEQQRRALDEAQARAAALASELAGTSSKIETQAAQSQKAVEEAVQQKQTAEATIAELRQSLQQERNRTEAMARDLASARRDERATGSRAVEGPMVPVTKTVAAAVSEPPTAADQEKAEAARLIARASALLSQGNIGAARTVLERAAENGNAQASFMLAETYDPVVLSAWGTYGTRGEAAKARELYAKAHSGGIREAKDRLDALPQ
ncbi:hypothetical protein [Bradyrhizobium sp. Ai1a-2]|uniref:hypothetical protein n=1 Tax=Bradyrhizobium sp. Ai1a-2 TaxID=196490 RepID=UPI0012689181|nr:hypothetical protein [Bradyrhizobium sp. Ai1a-2]